VGSVTQLVHIGLSFKCLRDHYLCHGAASYYKQINWICYGDSVDYFPEFSGRNSHDIAILHQTSFLLSSRAKVFSPKTLRLKKGLVTQIYRLQEHGIKCPNKQKHRTYVHSPDCSSFISIVLK
jgi:hypothetical protein